MTDKSVNNGVSVPEASKYVPLEKRKFPVYLIRSRWSLSSIDTYLDTYGGAGFLRIIYDSEGRETDRTIAILSEKVYDALVENGDDQQKYGKGFSVSPFLLRDNNFPGEGYTNNLFVPVPEELSSDDEAVITTISDKLQHLSDWDILPGDSWSINPLLKSREKGGIKGGCFISFKRDVPNECRAMVRILITDTYWPESALGSVDTVFRCLWARARKSNFGPKDKKKETGPKDKKKETGPKEEKKEAGPKEKKKETGPKDKKPEQPKRTQKKALVVPIGVQPSLKEGKVEA